MSSFVHKRFAICNGVNSIADQISVDEFREAAVTKLSASVIP